MEEKRTIQLTRGEIEKLKRMYEELAQIQWGMTDNVRTVQDRNGDNDIEIERDGKKVTCKEKEMWTELLYLGRERENKETGEMEPTFAYTWLANAYPEVFEWTKKENEAVNAIREYELRTFGFTSKEITLVRYIELTTALLEMVLQERGL